ncbi:hypothetical protein DEAC_c01430 [Desulfosporosinus acididurans]|uniref:Uncharacterized protein n=1 Tax=Desulfosporosinus acididurans TaxID=476652 RepID=A0A0J1FWF1_9FIRM|nr:hypothetical protein [Desulfosporosinus acididurans]KLU67739.1 hypothetical protein DEAC_c01430 [Desulfosporosinus acididurans]
MKACEGTIQRFTSTGQDSGIKELQDHETADYKLIYNNLIAKHIEACGEIPKGMDIQVINKIFTPKDENITPLGLVNVSLEYLARILTFAKRQGIQWQIDSREHTDTHFQKLSHFTVKVDCPQEDFMTMAKGCGYRY